MNHYKLLFEDFKRVFEFATSYYIEPTKTPLDELVANQED